MAHGRSGARSPASGSGAPTGPSPRPRARPRPGTRRSPRRHGSARSRGSSPRASGTIHCHWVRPATRALVSSELITGLPRTVLPDRRVRRPGPLDQPPQGVLDPALADREPEHVPTDLHQPLVADVMPLVEVAQQRLDPGPERPPWLQPRRIGARPSGLATVLAASRRTASASITTGANGGSSITWLRPTRRPPVCGSGSPQPVTRARATRDHHVRLAPHPADPDVPALRTRLPPPTARPGSPSGPATAAPTSSPASSPAAGTAPAPLRAPGSSRPAARSPPRAPPAPPAGDRTSSSSSSRLSRPSSSRSIVPAG